MRATVSFKVIGYIDCDIDFTKHLDELNKAFINEDLEPLTEEQLNELIKSFDFTTSKEIKNDYYDVIVSCIEEGMYDDIDEPNDSYWANPQFYVRR